MPLVNSIKVSILLFNFLVFIWGTLCFNSYRLMIESHLSIPANLYFNRLLFLIDLNVFINSISIVTIIFNFDRNDRNMFYIANLILAGFLSPIDYVTNDSCGNDCRTLLESNELYYASDLVEYLSLFQLLIVLQYAILTYYNYTRKRTHDYQNIDIQTDLNSENTRFLRAMHV